MPSESSMQFPPQKGNIKSWRETKINNMFGEDILYSTDQQLGKKVSSMAVLKKQKAGKKEKNPH